MSISNKIKVILSTLTSIYLFSVALTSTVNAQGVYYCTISGGSCAYDYSACDPGCVPPDPEQCQNVPPLYCCSGGVCRSFPCDCPEGAIYNPIGGALITGEPTVIISNLVQLFINVSFVIGVLIFIFMIITGAISWITSGGDKGKIAAARGRITTAIAGLLILFSLFFIIDFIEEVFDISITSLDLGDISL